MTSADIIRIYEEHEAEYRKSLKHRREAVVSMFISLGMIFAVAWIFWAELLK